MVVIEENEIYIHRWELGWENTSDPFPTCCRTGSKQGLTLCEMIAAWVASYSRSD